MCVWGGGVSQLLSIQIRGMAVLRYEQHLQKQLRSRQRKNYEHLVTRSDSESEYIHVCIIWTVQI